MLSGTWRISSRCATGACVAASFATEGTVLVRDTKTDHGSMLRFSAAEWRAFVAGLKHGDFQASPAS